MTVIGQPADWLAWLDRAGLDDVVVVSPHLDDAAFSLAGLLHATRARAEVITLITAAHPGPATDWTRATGFADNEAEARARQQEDLAAMAAIGCRHRHEGLAPGDPLAPVAGALVRALATVRPGGLARTLVLLPAGAGGPPPSPLVRLAWRLRRRPVGAPPHGEHVMARDLFWQALATSDARVGFYAELPYAWAQDPASLQAHLARALGCTTERLAYRPRLDEKERLVALYASQSAPILGTGAYRRRLLARSECLFIAGARSGPANPSAA